MRSEYVASWLARSSIHQLKVNVQSATESIVEVVGLIDTDKDLRDTFEEAFRVAKERGANKMLILICKDTPTTYESQTFKSSTLKYSDCVQLLEICKHGVIKAMDGP